MDIRREINKAKLRKFLGKAVMLEPSLPQSIVVPRVGKPGAQRCSA
jgi:hypothetical protein